MSLHLLLLIMSLPLFGYSYLQASEYAVDTISPLQDNRFSAFNYSEFMEMKEKFSFQKLDYYRYKWEGLGFYLDTCTVLVRNDSVILYEAPTQNHDYLQQYSIDSLFSMVEKEYLYSVQIKPDSTTYYLEDIKIRYNSRYFYPEEIEFIYYVPQYMSLDIQSLWRVSEFQINPEVTQDKKGGL